MRDDAMDSAGVSVGTQSTARDHAAALKLHAYLAGQFLNNGLLAGPDPVGRINGRFWRFVKHYFPAYQVNDMHMFLQTQGYWTIANWILFDATGDNRYREMATSCSDAMIKAQRADGGWDYPRLSYERIGLAATVEGVWACLGLLATYSREKNSECLAAAKLWEQFVERVMGYEVFEHPQFGECHAVNYYSPKPRGMVPNNATMLLNLKSLAFKLTGDRFFLAHFDQLLNFIRAAQNDNGELFYHYPDRLHYLCYQYNSYQFLDLAAVFRRTNDNTMLPILASSAAFLSKGQSRNGACRNDCHSNSHPEFDYHTAALADAFAEAHQLGLGDSYRSRAILAVDRLASRQRSDGSWGHSEGDWGGLLRDGRAYPRYLAMTLCHLLRITYPCTRGMP